MLDRFRVAAAMILVLGMTLPCAAQNTQMQQTHDPRACRDGRDTRADRFVPQPSAPGSRSLSERLEQTDGVICPPDVDPDIKAPTPDAGKMPVIPPPGSPGGDPTVRPK
jgi:hypothetical protein